MPDWIDHFLFVTLAVIFPLRAATFGFRRLLRASSAERPQVRRFLYVQAIALQWILSGAVALLWLGRGRAWTHLGLVPHPTWALAGVAAGFAVVATVILVQRRKAEHDDEALATVRNRLRNVEVMMPHTRAELGLFYRLAVTAGVCEELLYRGYLIWYFAHWTGVIPAAALASVLFGLGHSYQGLRGVLSTTLVGAFLAAVYLFTGSLFASMAIHAFMDLYAGSLGYLAFTRSPEPPAATEADESMSAGAPAAGATSDPGAGRP